MENKEDRPAKEEIDMLERMIRYHNDDRRKEKSEVREPKPDRKPGKAPAGFAALLFCLIALTYSLGAAAVTVTNGNDSGAGSLRDAIAAASPGGSIVFDPSVTTVTLTSGELHINKALSVDGAGQVTIIRDPGANLFRLVRAGPGPAVQGAQMPINLHGLGFEGGDQEGSSGGAIYVDENTLLTVENSRFENNNATWFGGAINIAATSKLIVHRSSFVDNTSWRGGAVSMPYGGSSEIERCLFKGNQSSTYGGHGGAIFVSSWTGDNYGQPAHGTLTASNSTFVENSSYTYGAAIYFYRQGDRSDSDSLPINVTATLINISVVDNVTEEESTTPLIRNSAVTTDSTDFNAGQVFVNIGNSLFRNEVTSLAGRHVVPAVYQFGSLGNNLFNDFPATIYIGYLGPDTDDMLGTDPQLGAFNGEVFPLQAGTPAVWGANDDICPATDQRGITRPQGAHCDIGAAELVIDTTTLTVTVSGEGQVSADPDPVPAAGGIESCDAGGGANCSADYLLASEVSLVASPAPGHHFVAWGEDCAGTDTATTVTLHDDSNCTAAFAINQYTLEYSAGSGGSIDGDTPQTVDHGSDGSAVTALPGAGYHFVQWSDGNTGALRTDTQVTSDLTVTAEFAPSVDGIFEDRFQNE